MRKVKVYKPCMDCGGSPYQEGGSPRDCTGVNFGGPHCPKGSPEYELAKTFRKTIKEREDQLKGDTTSQNQNLEEYVNLRRDTMQKHLSRNNLKALAEQMLVEGLDFQLGGPTLFDQPMNNERYTPPIEGCFPGKPGCPPEGQIRPTLETPTTQELPTEPMFKGNVDPASMRPSVKTPTTPVINEEGIQDPYDNSFKRGTVRTAKHTIGPAMDFTAMIGRSMTEPNYEQKITDETAAHNVFSVGTGYDRGFNTVNKTGFDPVTGQTPVQFTGFNMTMGGPIYPSF